jgi:hypothetical protein
VSPGVRRSGLLDTDNAQLGLLALGRHARCGTPSLSSSINGAEVRAR